MNHKVSIVGANGFIGSNLSKKLSDLNFELELFHQSYPIVINGELNPSARNSDVVIWCASTVNPISASNNPHLVANEFAYWGEFLNLLHSSGNRALKVIFLSSGGCTYSGDVIPFTETDDAFGTNLYGKLKLQMELTLIESGIDWIILRIANVYGPSQPAGRGQGVIAEWVNSISKGRPLSVYGEMDSFRDYIYVEDLSYAIYALLNSGVKNQTFNIGSGDVTTLYELKELFSELAGIEISTVVSTPRGIDRQGYVLNIDKISRAIDWAPKFTLREGIRICLK